MIFSIPIPVKCADGKTREGRATAMVSKRSDGSEETEWTLILHVHTAALDFQEIDQSRLRRPLTRLMALIVEIVELAANPESD